MAKKKPAMKLPSPKRSETKEAALSWAAGEKDEIALPQPTEIEAEPPRVDVVAGGKVAATMAVSKPVVVVPVLKPKQSTKKADYIKLTVTVPPEAYLTIMNEVTRRRTDKLSDPTIAGVIRDALQLFSKA